MRKKKAWTKRGGKAGGKGRFVPPGRRDDTAGEVKEVIMSLGGPTGREKRELEECRRRGPTKKKDLGKDEAPGRHLPKKKNKRKSNEVTSGGSIEAQSEKTGTAIYKKRKEAPSTGRFLKKIKTPDSLKKKPKKDGLGLFALL